jgi:ankyrin repeat protein
MRYLKPPAVLFAALATAVGAGAAATDQRLADAVEQRSAALVTSLVKQGADVNGAQPDGATALHWAAHWDDLTTVDLLLRSGARPDPANDHGVSPLALACENGSVPIVERLLAAGADPNTATTTGVTAVMTAARGGSLGAVKALIARGANVNAAEPAHGQTALMWAVAQRHADVAQTLIENGADVRARSITRHRTIQTGNRYGDQNSIKGSVGETDLGGFTPLLFAARAGDLASAGRLLSAGAPVDDAASNGATALTLAAHSGQGSVARLLLERGANPNAAGAGYTPLHAAVLRGDRELLAQLLGKGADPNARLTKGTPSRYYSKDFAFNEMLIGATPLLLAARYGEVEMMQLLGSAGADAKAALPDGTTVLMTVIASTRGYGAFRAGDRRERYQGPADVAAKVEGEDERVTLEAAKVAIKLGVDVSATTKDGDTALHLAASQSLDSVIPLLVEHGARLDARNKRDQTPLAITTVAAMRGFYAMDPAQRQATAELLRKLGATD